MEPAVGQLVKYLETLFEASENVGYVTGVVGQRTANICQRRGAGTGRRANLIQALNSCKGDIGGVLGDYKPDAGAWIRFNPLDGKGAKNENVTEFRLCAG